MPIRIIDNKKIDLTEDEYALYSEIVKSYTTQFASGDEYFKDLFETDDNGIIIFLKPASSRYISMEIWMFIMAIQQSQHLRLMHKKVEEFCKVK